MISRNRRAGETAAVGLLVDGGQVGMIATDMDKNLLVSCYKPDMKESAGGKQLVRQCDFNLGKILTLSPSFILALVFNLT